MAADMEEAITTAGLALGVQLKSEQQQAIRYFALGFDVFVSLPTPNRFVTVRCRLFSTVSVGNQAP